jgi:hypothetical protein
MGEEQEILRAYSLAGTSQTQLSGAAADDCHAGPEDGRLGGVQGVLRHDKIETTGNVYMQEIERSVQRTMNSIYNELRASRSRSER